MVSVIRVLEVEDFKGCKHSARTRDILGLKMREMDKREVGDLDNA